MATGDTDVSKLQLKSLGVAMMLSAAPHYLLLCEVNSDSSDSGTEGRWMFMLERLGSSERLEVSDAEPSLRGERLQLLAVVRGLEALPQPSRVTLITSSRYVARGIRLNLNRWRENDFQWERFGTMAPIKNRDLWRRISRAMEIHRVDCRGWQLQAASSMAAAMSRFPGSRLEQDTLVSAEGDQKKEAQSSNSPKPLYDHAISIGQATRDQWSRVASAVSSRIRSIGVESSFDCAML